MNQDHDGRMEQRRDLELGAALSALPHPQLPDDMDARLRAAIEVERRRRRRRRSVATLGLAATLAALVLGGAALAGAFDANAPSQLPDPPLPAKSVYPVNANGQTYGAMRPSLYEVPDLIAVQATNGKTGYCLKGDLMPPHTASTPEEVAEENERNLKGYTIPVYKSDGVTQIGVFQSGGPGSSSGGTAADGTKWEQHADADGSIVTTTTHPDGTVTIATEAPDGAVTTKTLTAAEAARLKAAASPSPRASSKPEPDKPQAWLLEHMTQVARDAGDAHATARWELQWRKLAAAIEGDAAPSSVYAREASVWIVILHGDFRDGGWMYEVLDRDSHNVLSEGTSTEPYDTSALPPMQGPITLNGD